MLFRTDLLDSKSGLNTSAIATPEEFTMIIALNSSISMNLSNRDCVEKFAINASVELSAEIGGGYSPRYSATRCCVLSPSLMLGLIKSVRT